MKPYDKYKDSSVEWIGEIPEHWEVIKIRYVASRVETGKTPPTKNPEYFDGDVDWFTPGDYEGSIILQSSDKKISELAVNELDLKIYPPETVLLVGIGATLGKVGMTVNPAFSNQQINAIIFDKQKLNPLFGTYFLNSQKKRIVSSSNSATLSILNQSKTKDFELLCPPLEEQQHIAAYLDHRTAQIDDLINKKQRMIALLQEERAAVINRAVTTGLDPSVKMKDSGVEWIGEVPEHWETQQLKYVVTFQRGHDLPTQIREEGDVPIVSSGGVTGTHSVAQAKSPGIVTGRYGTIGDFHLIEEDYWPLNTTLYSINLWDNNARFVWYLLHQLSDLFLANSKKSAVPGVNRNDLHPVPIAIPSSIEEQKSIVAYLDEKTSKIDTAISQAEKQITLLQEYRTALISEVVTGKLDVRGEVLG